MSRHGPDQPPGETTSHVVEQLVAAGRHAVEHGLVLASGGNLSARAPGSEEFVVTGTGTWLDRLTPQDFAVVGLDGEHRAGPTPSVEWKLHQRTYAVRPDVSSVVHLHPQYAVLVDMLGHRIRCTTLDHAYYLGAVARVQFATSGSSEIAEACAEAARHHDAIVLAHHGCSTLGASVEVALRRALNLEEAATMTYRLLLTGDTTTEFPAQWRDRIIAV